MIVVFVDRGKRLENQGVGGTIRKSRTCSTRFTIEPSPPSFPRNHSRGEGFPFGMEWKFTHQPWLS